MTKKWAAVAALGALTLAGCAGPSFNGNAAVCRDYEMHWNAFASGKESVKDSMSNLQAWRQGASGQVAAELGVAQITPAKVAEACSATGNPITLQPLHAS